jgi:hypothetical protein
MSADDPLEVPTPLLRSTRISTGIAGLDKLGSGLMPGRLLW